MDQASNPGRPPTNTFPLPIRLELDLAPRLVFCDYKADKTFTVVQERREGNLRLGSGTFGEMNGKHRVLSHQDLPEHIVAAVERAIQLHLGETGY